MRTFQGRWRITVIGVEAEWPQRAVVRTRNGTTVIPGTLNASHQVDADTWQLSLEHEFNGDWRPNVRALMSAVTDNGGTETQLIRSKDRDWRHDKRERNLVLRLERLGARRDEPVTEARRSTLPRGPPARRSTRTSTAAISGSRHVEPAGGAFAGGAGRTGGGARVGSGPVRRADRQPVTRSSASAARCMATPSGRAQRYPSAYMCASSPGSGVTPCSAR